MERPGDLEITVEALSETSATVVRVHGDLDMATCPECETALEGTDPGKRTVIDLLGCTFLDSSALRVLIATARDAGSAGGDVLLVAQDPGILRVLQIASVDTMCQIHETVESAAITQVP
ncbi:hypothetical protein BH18ACT13_BH18ACT13_10850 [soil metagenome]